MVLAQAFKGGVVYKNSVECKVSPVCAVSQNRPEPENSMKSLHAYSNGIESLTSTNCRKTALVDGRQKMTGTIGLPYHELNKSLKCLKLYLALTLTGQQKGDGLCLSSALSKM